ALRNVRRRRADRAAVLDDRLPGGNRHDGDLVTARDRFAHGDGRAAVADEPPGLERFERGRDVVVRADHDHRVHWLTPLASSPPSTTSSWPVTKLGGRGDG